MAGAGTLDRGHDDEVLRASRVSRFSLSSPPTAASAGLMAAVALLLVPLLVYGPASLDATTALEVALVALLLPAYLSAWVAYALMGRLEGTITKGRVVLLGATDLVVVLAFTVAGSLIPWPSGDAWLWGLLVGVALAASVNMLVLAATSYPRLAVAAIPGVGFAAGSVGLVALLGVVSLPVAAVAALFVLVFLASAVVWARVVVAPFRRAFGENGLVLLQALLDAWAGWSATGVEPAKGTLAMEAFFARHGSARPVRFTAGRFSLAGGREHLWFLPDLHPGPYADLGGSDLPSKAAAALAGPSRTLSTFHGATTHDENPCGRQDLGALFAQVGPSIGHDRSAAVATESRRFSEGGATLLAQQVGDFLVLTHTRAPRSSDDIDWSVGMAAEGAGSVGGTPPVVLLDAHNAVAEDLGRTPEGSAEAEALRRLAAAAAREMEGAPRAALRVGVAQLVPEEPLRREFAVGKQGLSATVVAAGEHTTAYLLIDGNNLKGGLRETILQTLEGVVDDAEVMTTDNHAVNTTMGADNEVGSRGDNAALVALATRAVREAAAGLEPATVGWTRAEVPGVRVFGRGLTVQMSKAINAAVGRMIPAYLLATGAATGACALLARLAF